MAAQPRHVDTTPESRPDTSSSGPAAARRRAPDLRQSVRLDDEDGERSIASGHQPRQWRRTRWRESRIAPVCERSPRAERTAAAPRGPARRCSGPRRERMGPARAGRTSHRGPPTIVKAATRRARRGPWWPSRHTEWTPRSRYRPAAASSTTGQRHPAPTDDSDSAGWMRADRPPQGCCARRSPACRTHHEWCARRRHTAGAQRAPLSRRLRRPSVAHNAGRRHR